MPGPIDPLGGPKLALKGRVVTMDGAWTVLPAGVVYIEQGRIAAVRPAGSAPPDGFLRTKMIDTGGTIFPGLIELHNHLSYNALRLWSVPDLYTNRDGWSGINEYRRRVTAPMTVVGKTPTLMPAVIRYVETKCLVAGVTTSQGIALFSNAGARRYYRGIVRNVEQTDDPDLPDADTRIGDVQATDAAAFAARLAKSSCLLLHLSEGTDARAERHFRALRWKNRTWAITDGLAGIHCVALSAADLGVMGSHGGAMVWSPMSNLLLYGKTAHIKRAKMEGLRIGIGSDWSVSGSKNLLGELKVARLVSAVQGGVFSDRDIVAMATCEAARILKWDKLLGSIEPSKCADLVVIDSGSGDPYAGLITAHETAVRLVMINGVARYGDPDLIKSLTGAAGAAVKVGGERRALYLKQSTADPDVGKISYATARDALASALHELPKLAQDLARAAARPARRALTVSGAEPPVWMLALDELGGTGLDMRPRLPAGRMRAPTGPKMRTALPAKPLKDLVSPLDLDPLTVADDSDFLEVIAKHERNLPDAVRAGLRQMY